jgi:hypothetical protein
VEATTTDLTVTVTGTDGIVVRSIVIPKRPV